jgi:hypothetical protein
LHQAFFGLGWSQHSCSLGYFVPGGCCLLASKEEPVTSFNTIDYHPLIGMFDKAITAHLNWFNHFNILQASSIQKIRSKISPCPMPFKVATIKPISNHINATLNHIKSYQIIYNHH